MSPNNIAATNVACLNIFMTTFSTKGGGKIRDRRLAAPYYCTNNRLPTKVSIPNPLDFIRRSPSPSLIQYRLVYNRKVLRLPFSKRNATFGEVVR
jgi:hypothetical protein